MPIIKLGEAHEIRLENTATWAGQVSPEVLENFQKFAANLKRIAPKAEDFLYFSAVMMHAAEAAALNEDGTNKLTLKGETVQVGWDKSGNTWKWTSNDPNIKPYKNSNGDIFPEEELTKAHKKWKHKPLCVDHKSSSVDHVRGFIVDTHYDPNLKRVIALCALDKAGFPQLARQISTGVSNCVSMGTAVGRAICYDCQRVARTEADFCNHMKNKTCYGEINVDLNPIELSIVVNGADPRANIKHIIAAANTMNTYLENRAKELDKLAELVYTANITVSDNTGTPDNKSTQININATDLNKFRTDIEDAFTKLQDFKSTKISEKDTNDLASNQSSGSIAMDEGAPTDSGLALQTPQTVRFASADVEAESIAELQEVTASIEARLNQMKKSLDKLAKSTSTKTQEENMSGSDKLNKHGYFQGGGGVNEPTPGQVKYPKDPLNEELRAKEDKQMVGQPPFPEVGPVDGMHPSPESADPSNELERKKMLARAEYEEKQMKRNAIVQMAKQALENKQAYWLGGGGVNEPTPGKPKYPKDKLNEELREYEDKQMVGQPPFPGVGPVDGLHPSPSSADPKDELKRKEMLARAGFRARFVKAATNDGRLNKNKSAWEVFYGDKLLLTASVDDLCGGHVTDVLYDNIASKPFGASLIEKVKVQGAPAVQKLIKKAQVPPAPPGGDPSSAPPVGDPGGDPGAGAPDAGPPAEDAGKSGDPKQSAMELAEKVRDLSSDLVEAVRALTGEQAEMGGGEAAPAGGVGGPAGGPMAADDMDARKKKDSGSSSKESTASFSTETLNTLRKELNGALTHAMKEAIADLNGHQQELEMISGMYDKGAVNGVNQDFIGTIVEEALNETKSAMADGFKLMQAFIKYARGTKAIVKRAEIEAELQSLAEGDSMSNERDSHSADGGDLMGLINDTNADLDAVHEMMGDDGLGDEPEGDHEDGLGDLGLEGLLEGGEGLAGLAADDNDGVQVETPAQAGEVLKQNPEASVMVGKKATASFDSKQGRAILRAKLAADATGKYDSSDIMSVEKIPQSDMFDQADGLTDGQTQLDTKPSSNTGEAKFPLGLVETPEESLKAMLEVARMPPKVRKEAEAIQRLVSEGKLDPRDVDALVAEGLDKDAVAYWKKYFGEVDGGSEFASELVKEHVKAAMEEELNKFRVKLARSYETAYDMAERDMCRSDRAAISAQVDELMKFTDDNFDSLKRVIARREPVLSKKASRVPQVGLRDESEFTSQASALTTEDEYAQLSSLFGTKKGVF
jgi:hypothetical protein